MEGDVTKLALIARTHLRILGNPTAATTGAAAIQDGADADYDYEEGGESDAEFQDDPLVEACFRGSLGYNIDITMGMMNILYSICI